MGRTKKTNETTNGEQQANGGVTPPKGIRLISLYIGSFGPFKGQIMNFCSDYRTEVKNSNGRLHLEVTHEKVLPDSFFALNEGNGGNGCVKSVSAIIGKNGSGKTSLARLLCNLPASDDRKPGWKTVLIYEDNGEIKCYSTFSSVTVELIAPTGMRRTIVPDGIFLPYKLFYYSPHFTTEQFEIHTTGFRADSNASDEGGLVKNISTTALLLHPDGNSELLPVVGAKQASVFDADEKIRLFEFIADYKAKGKKLVEKFDMPMPERISIGIHNEGLQLAVHDIRANADRIQIVKKDLQEKRKIKLSSRALVNPVDKYLKEVGEVLDEYRKTISQYNLVVNVFMSYAARYIQESGIFNASFPVEELDQGFLADLKDFLVSGKWVKESSIRRFFKGHRPELPPKGNEKSSSPDSNPMLELIDLLQRFCKDSKKQSKLHSPTVRIVWGSLLCQLGVPEVLNDVCRLVQLHAQTRVISPYLKFDVFPHMSSGEMSFLTMFARLYRFVGKKNENIVVFLDEAETTLHPEWQRRLVSYCIRFFEVFLPDNNYQLIFASHSPMLLTDVPKQNVVFVNEKHCVVDVRRQKAFAANIFELYKDSFLLDKGQIGEFAASKVNELMKKLNSGRKEKILEDDLKVASLIDDPFISRHVWRRLRPLAMDNDMPEDEITEG